MPWLSNHANARRVAAARRVGAKRLKPVGPRVGHALLVDELGEHLPGLGERTMRAGRR